MYEQLEFDFDYAEEQQRKTMIQVHDHEELLIDILQMLGVDFVVQGKGYDEYHVALPSV